MPAAPIDSAGRSAHGSAQLAQIVEVDVQVGRRAEERRLEQYGLRVLHAPTHTHARRRPTVTRAAYSMDLPNSILEAFPGVPRTCTRQLRHENGKPAREVALGWCAPERSTPTHGLLHQTANRRP